MDEVIRSRQFNKTMEPDSQESFEDLASDSQRLGFKTRFRRIAGGLGLNIGLNQNELARLYEAAFLAALCNISFNGLGGCGGTIQPEKEPTRWRLEQAYMDACQKFYRCKGWKALTPAQRKSVCAVFLAVEVSDENLAD
jgi:hypothetical protein